MISLGRWRSASAAHLVEVDPLVLPAHAIADRLEPLARDVRRRAMGQMAAGRERHAQDGVAGLQQSEKHREVRRRSAVRLHVDVRAAEQPPRPVDRQLLGDIHELAAAIVAPPRIALGVLVGEHAALGFEHGGAGEVLRRDQLDLPLLAPDLSPDRRSDLGVAAPEGGVRRTPGAYRGGLQLGSRTSDPRRRTDQACGEDIFATRRAWRPPANGVLRKVSRQSRATSRPSSRAPSARTLASLCSRARRAVVTS